MRRISWILRLEESALVGLNPRVERENYIQNHPEISVTLPTVCTRLCQSGHLLHLSPLTGCRRTMCTNSEDVLLPATHLEEFVRHRHSRHRYIQIPLTID